MDTLSHHSFSYSFRRGRLRCGHNETPIGYGTAFSDDNLPDSAYTDADSRADNPEASAEADLPQNVANGFEPTTIGGGAIPAFHELSENALQQEDRHTVVLVDGWAASGPGNVRSKIQGPAVFPYPFLQAAEAVVDPLITLFEFNSTPPQIGKVEPDRVPADRLRPYQ